MSENQQQVPVDSKYLPELMAEKDSIDPSFVHAVRLISNEITKIQNPQSDDKKPASGDIDLLDGNENRPTKVAICIKVPIDKYPSFNFVGRLLGPGGSTLKGIQTTTSTQIAILGKGSMRDKKKAEELASGGEAKYQHLNYPLHVKVSTVAPLGQAYISIGHAVTELLKLMQPSPEDQMMDGGAAVRGGGQRGRGRGGRGATPARGGSGRGAARGGRGGVTQRGGAGARGRGASVSRGGYGAKAADPYAAQSYDSYGMESYEGYGADAYADASYDAYGAEAYAEGYGADASYADAGYGGDAYAYGDASSYDAYGNGAEAAQYTSPASKPFRGKMRGGTGRGRASSKPY